MSGSMPLRRGTHKPLEEAADRMLKESLAGVTRHSDKADILTPWKMQERQRREVMVPSGTPDASLRQGIFTRALNPTHPHLNSRQGTAGRGRRGAPSVPSDIQTLDFIDWDSE